MNLLDKIIQEALEFEEDYLPIIEQKLAETRVIIDEKIENAKTYSKYNELPNGSAKDNVTRGCIVLEGGALRGLFTSGVLDELMLSNINFECVIGCSAGTLNGINYVSGDIGRSARINLGSRFNDEYLGYTAFKNNQGIFGFDYILHGFDDTDPVNMERFNNPNRRLLATVTNLNTGEAEYHEKGVVEDFFLSAQASASMPYVSEPVMIQGNPYLDGGCACKIPYQWALDQGFDKIVVVRTREKDFRFKVTDNITVQNKLLYSKYEAFSSALDSSRKDYNKAADELQELAESGRIFMITPEHMSILHLEMNIEKLGEIYEHGREVTNKQLEDLKEYLMNK